MIGKFFYSFFNLTPILLSGMLVSWLLISCNAETPSQTSPPQQKSVEKTHATDPSQDLRTNFLNGAQQQFELLHQSAKVLAHSVSEFTKQPSPELLMSAHNAWEHTHDQYLATQIFRNINLTHPQLDLSQSSPVVIHPVQIRLDQHPVIPGYLDAVAGYPASGIIYSELVISEENLNNEHQFSDTAYVAMGFHALEFMLEGDPYFESPHSSRFARISDEVPSTLSEPSPESRRSRYILVLADLIVADLQRLSSAWSSKDGFYLQTLWSITHEQSNKLILDALELENTALITSKVSKDKITTPHQSKSVLTARAALLASIVDRIAKSGYLLPSNLHTITSQAAPEQTKP